MSHGTHYYKIQSKEELIDYLAEDFKRIAYGILKQKIVCEGQYGKLNSHLIEEHGGMLIEVLSELIGEEVVYDYSSVAGLYCVYICKEIMREDALVEVQRWRDFYYL